jgi:hypothetical protein
MRGTTMKIAKISELNDELNEANGVLEFGDDEREREEFAGALGEMAAKADNDNDALIVFFEFITDDRGGDTYEWDSKEFRDAFEETFRGADSDADKLLKEYYEGYEDSVLSPMIADKHVADYFDWTSYTQDQRPDLHVIERGSMSYLFESE